MEKFQGSEGKKEDEEKKYLDVISNKNIKLSERVLIPVKQYPKFNFVGKLLGPRGNSLKRLQEETGAKMSILGKGSMRDKAKDWGRAMRGVPVTTELRVHMLSGLCPVLKVWKMMGEQPTNQTTTLQPNNF
ncbi:KH domain-containing, RNA-binding, signal transduction-associated protein 2-like isoform X3 [Cyanistes caeruleus]|uniref:KH domain-containing, RNA-binding, signal transduction-associated protein 2-like isoform X3 n=1 Tax=Cyanistes caeruleus TaxID=156563 RepID=UPI000CDBA35B|nr:KH domain-containing, RNA-binding, signal transduction-associated protein 2-like isoform X3 [Cyanistes caeruleus]